MNTDPRIYTDSDKQSVLTKVAQDAIYDAAEYAGTYEYARARAYLLRADALLAILREAYGDAQAD